MFIKVYPVRLIWIQALHSTCVRVPFQWLQDGTFFHCPCPTSLTTTLWNSGFWMDNRFQEVLASWSIWQPGPPSPDRLGGGAGHQRSGASWGEEETRGDEGGAPQCSFFGRRRCSDCSWKLLKWDYLRAAAPAADPGRPERIPKANPAWNSTETLKKLERKLLRDVNL